MVWALLLLCAGCGAKANNALHDHEPGSRGDECPLGQVVCDGTCTDVATDPAHCGGCDSPCGDGDECRSGRCGGSDDCPAAMVGCGSECRDLSGDPEYCGGCDGYVCRSKESCWNGVCTCRPELTPCGEAGCIDTLSDPASCGACGAACESGVCQRGACVDACAGALTECGGGCVDLQANPLHCGGCGHDCAQDQYCLSGHCVDYEPAVHCAGSCNGCDCPEDEKCCDLPGYGVSCVDTRQPCPEPPTQH